jgi:hypothetical protein
LVRERRPSLYVERYALEAADRSTMTDASPPILGSVVFAGLTFDASLASLALWDLERTAAYDELPSDAGYLLRVASDRLEPVALVVERAGRSALRMSVGISPLYIQQDASRPPFCAYPPALGNQLATRRNG